MNEKQYQYQQMLQEYNTLRAEILQVYEQQMNLVFSAALTAVGTLLITLVQSQASLLSLPILLAMLIGVCYKSIGNYNRIFRIGSYLSVVHEQQGQSIENFKPDLEKAAWHTRWRRLSRSKELHGKFHWVGAEAPRAESLFLCLLGIGGWSLAIGSLKGNLFIDIFNIAIFFISVILTLLLFYFAYQFAGVLGVSKRYEEAFRHELDLEKETKKS